MAVGGQREIADDVLFELAGSYETVNPDGANFSQIGYQIGAGAALKREFDPFVVSASANFGGYWLDHGRTHQTTSGTHLAGDEFHGQFVGGELRAYSVDVNGGVYVRRSFCGL
ncbi:MAG: hypothetical protein JJ902_04780 [Roseibium sp.]|nr:hypothetical protein [Roseibium sp.]